ncbi:hypothetical protein HC174_03860 [Salinimicrobium sp. CDJ15-81-2]|nr:hypothetical protein [Salinimicrobium nanhaiense]
MIQWEFGSTKLEVRSWKYEEGLVNWLIWESLIRDSENEERETRKQETLNLKQGTGNREQGTGNWEQGTGNREQGTGKRNLLQKSLGSWLLSLVSFFTRNPQVSSMQSAVSSWQYLEGIYTN